MTKIPLLALLVLLAAGSPLAAQVRTASIGVSARVAEPLRMEPPAAVKLEYSQGRYLDVTTPVSVPGAAGYLVHVVVERPTGTTAEPSSAAQPRRLPGGEARHRIDLREDELPEGEAVRVTYVVATNL